MTTFTIDLPDEQAQTLQQQAQRAGVAPEDLLRQRVESWLSPLPAPDESKPTEDDFAAATAYVLTKNADLYRRLS